MSPARWHCFGGVRSVETKHGIVFATWSKDHANVIIPSEIKIDHLDGINLDYITHSGVIGPLRTNTANTMLPHKERNVD